MAIQKKKWFVKEALALSNMETILNKKNVNYLKQPLFLGEDLSLQRYDRFKYPKFFDLYKKQLEFFWRPEEIELKKA